MEKDKKQYVDSIRGQYPYEFEAPYEGIPKDVKGNFVWAPDQTNEVALFLFDDEADRAALAARYSRKRKKKAA